jgi:hypothetical protein
MSINEDLENLKQLFGLVIFWISDFNKSISDSK